MCFRLHHLWTVPHKQHGLIISGKIYVEFILLVNVRNPNPYEMSILFRIVSCPGCKTFWIAISLIMKQTMLLWLESDPYLTGEKFNNSGLISWWNLFSIAGLWVWPTQIVKSQIQWRIYSVKSAKYLCFQLQYSWWDLLVEKCIISRILHCPCFHSF